MNILAIDFGLKNIGLAFSEGILVESLGRLKNTPKVLNQLEKICLDNKIELIIIGFPQGKLVASIKDFAAKIRKKIKLPVIFQDETLTSKEAIKKMVEARKPLKKRKIQEDVIAACLILQSYLDHHT